MSLVYFVGSPDGIGLVKIGCSTDPLLRLRSILLASPIHVEMLAFCAGDLHTEHAFHARHEAAHRHGEWFERSASLMDDIARLAAGSFDMASLEMRPRRTVKGPGWWLPRGEAQKLRDEGRALTELARAFRDKEKA